MGELLDISYYDLHISNLFLPTSWIHGSLIWFQVIKLVFHLLCMFSLNYIVFTLQKQYRVTLPYKELKYFSCFKVEYFSIVKNSQQNLRGVFLYYRQFVWHIYMKTMKDSKQERERWFKDVLAESWHSFPKLWQHNFASSSPEKDIASFCDFTSVTRRQTPM